MPSWYGWIQEYDHRATFRDFRKLVQLLLWKYPPPSGGHLLLKCILTTARIQIFAEEFPEANFVLVHRDPFRITTSAATISEAIYKPFIREQPGPLHEDGLHDQTILKRLKMMFRALVKFMKAEPERIANVQYTDLMSDAGMATRSAFNYFAIDFPEDLEQSIVAYLERQRSGKRVAPPKKYDTYGYDAEAVWTDPRLYGFAKRSFLAHLCILPTRFSIHPFS